MAAINQQVGVSGNGLTPDKQTNRASDVNLKCHSFFGSHSKWTGPQVFYLWIRLYYILDNNLSMLLLHGHNITNAC